MGEIYLKSW